MALEATVASKIFTNEILENEDLLAPVTLPHGGYDESTLYTATSAPNVTKAAYQEIALVAGAKTIDLTSLLLNGLPVSLSGDEPRGLRIKNTGAANMTIVFGASNPYEGMGAAFNVTLKPGQSFLFDFAGVGNEVDGTHKTLDVTGDGADTFELSVVAGD